MPSFTRFLKKVKAIYTFKKNATQLGKVNLSFNARCKNNSNNKKQIIIGKNSKIQGSLFAYNQGIIEIGEDFYMGPNSVIGSKEKIVIGNQVIISNDVTIYDNNNHPISPKKRYQMSISGSNNEKWEWKYADSKPIIIEDNVWIGQYSSILKGVIIGKGSIIGTRSVVTKDVPEYSIVAGNPAQVVKSIDNDFEETHFEK